MRRALSLALSSAWWLTLAHCGPTPNPNSDVVNTDAATAVDAITVTPDDAALDGPAPADAAPNPTDGPAPDGGCTRDDDCPLGSLCGRSGRCAPGCNATHGCPGMTDLCCNGMCLDGSSDPMNCGACGTVCGSAHASSSCARGSCQVVCERGFGNCDRESSNGCEAPLDTPAHCGSCERDCGSGTCDAERGVCGGYRIASVMPGGWLGIAASGTDLYVVGNSVSRIYRVAMTGGASSVFRDNGSASMRGTYISEGRLFWTDYVGGGTLRSAALSSATGVADEVMNVGAPQNGGAGGILVEPDAFYMTTFDTGLNAVIHYDRALRFKERLEGNCGRFGGGVVRHPVTRNIIFGCALETDHFVYRTGVNGPAGMVYDLGAGHGVYSMAVRGTDIFVGTGSGGIVRINGMTGEQVTLTTATAYGVTTTATHIYWVDASQFVWGMRM